MATDRQAAARAIEAFLRALGHDPDADPELRGTPQRVADAWADELLGGAGVDVGALLAAESSAAAPGPAGVVALRGVKVVSVCPHHLLPARGAADVAYVPGARVAGLGTLARVVRASAQRLALQETVGQSVVAALVDHLGARAAACRIVLVHECVSARGAREDGARAETMAFAGTAAAPGPDRDLCLSGLADGR